MTLCWTSLKERIRITETGSWLLGHPRALSYSNILLSHLIEYIAVDSMDKLTYEQQEPSTQARITAIEEALGQLLESFLGCTCVFVKNRLLSQTPSSLLWVSLEVTAEMDDLKSYIKTSLTDDNWTSPWAFSELAKRSPQIQNSWSKLRIHMRPSPMKFECI